MFVASYIGLIILEFSKKSTIPVFIAGVFGILGYASLMHYLAEDHFYLFCMTIFLLGVLYFYSARKKEKDIPKKERKRGFTYYLNESATALFIFGSIALALSHYFH